MKLLQKLRNKIAVATMQADKEIYFKNISRVISPSTIEEFPTHIRINGETLARTIIAGIPPVSSVGGYPSDLNPRVIDELMNLSTSGYQIAYSFAVLPISNIDSMKMLDDAIYHNKVSQESFKDKNNPHAIAPLKKIFEQDDFAQNYKAIYQNTQKMYHTAFVIIFFGKTEGQLRAAESHVKVLLESNRVSYECPDYRQLDTFLSAQPFPFTQNYCWCELFSYHTAALLGTRNTNSRTDEQGLLFGSDMKTGKDILIDLQALSSQHLFIVGATGAGKTYTSLMLLSRAYTMLQKRIIYTTTKSDVGTHYRAVCNYFNGSIIDIGNGESNINPLQILFDLQSHGNMIKVFDDHFELLTQFFNVLFEGISINMTNYLSESLMETYNNYGIMREFPETWENCKKWPTMLDLRAVWLKDSKDIKNVTARALADKSFLFTTSWSFLNNATNIDLSANFIVCDMSNVPESLKNALNVLVTGIMAMRFKTDTKKGTIICVDEGAVYLHQKELSTFLLRALTQGRSFNISLWLSTQQPSDLVKASLSEEFKTNMQLSIVLGNMRSDTIDICKNFFKLDKNATQDLLDAGVGEGLLLVGEERIPIRFKPTPLEDSIIKGKTTKEYTTLVDGISLIHEKLYPIVADQNVVFQEWVNGDDMGLKKLGFEHKRTQRAVGNGLVRIWIKKGMLMGNTICNQTLDHFSTCAYIQGYLVQNAIDAQISHLEGADITFNTSKGMVYIEYEHGQQEIKVLHAKKEKITEGRLVFVGNASNIKYLYEAIGEQNVIKRGNQLKEFLDEIIEEEQKL